MTNWKEYRLSEFIDINPKIALKGGSIYSFVEMKDLNDGQKYVLPSQEKKLTGGSRFQNGDTLFARITPCLENGKICQVKGLKNNVGFGSTEFLVLRGKENISNTDFIFYLSRYDIVRRFAEQNLVGTSGRQRVSKNAFEKLIIDLPDVISQSAIAEILTSFDDKIELNNQINQNLETLSQALFKQWFIDFDYPVENGLPYKSSGGEMVDSELGEIPKGWIIEKLGNLVNTTSGGTPSRSKPEYYENGNILWVKSKELNNSMFFDTGEKINEIGLKNSSAKKVPPYSILIAMYGATVGQFGLITEEATCNQAICAVIPNEKLPYSFIYLFIQNYRKEFSNLAVGSAQQNISQDLIKNTKLIKPPLEMLKEFHKIIDTSLKTIENNCRENNELKNLRNSLLPKLISGELKISDVKILEPV